MDWRGEEWPLENAPRSPVLRVELSTDVWVDGGEPVAAWLFPGQLDQPLREDLVAPPLRQSSLERALPCEVVRGAGTLELRPEGRLPRGARLTLAIASWLRSSVTGAELGAPWWTEIVVSEAADAGASLTDSWPADASGGVPSNLLEAALRFDGPLEASDEGIELLDESGQAQPIFTSLAPCADLGWPDGWCVRVGGLGVLLEGREYELRVSEHVLDTTGAPVGPATVRFRTTYADLTPPSIDAIACALDETSAEGLCLLSGDDRVSVTWRASEAVRASLSVDGRRFVAVAPRGQGRFLVGGMSPLSSQPAVLRVQDLAGLEHERPLALQTTEPLAPLSITEVCSDPEGTEPRQEYVEVLNYGRVSIDLAGYSIADEAFSDGSPVGRSVVLAPGQRALLVPETFDPENSAGPPIAPGVLLVPVGRALGVSGLANAGEPVYLRDPHMRRLSAAPATSTGPGRCLSRVGADLRDGADAAFAVGPCTPGLAP
jgi:hypothetical protein